VKTQIWIAISNENTTAKIVQRIAKLGFDPKPFNEECASKVVQNLKKYKINKTT